MRPLRCTAPLALALALGACASGLPEPGSAHLAVARADEPDASLPALTRGRTLYARRCAGCHALKHPAALPPDAWAPEVEEMRRTQGVRLNAEEASDIVRYLRAASAVARR